jgi:hypothetical protein
VTHSFHAIPDKHRRGFLAQYVTPRGVAYVRDQSGAARIFATERKAEKAAMVALCHALDRPPAAAKGTTINVRRSSRWAVADRLFNGA